MQPKPFRLKDGRYKIRAFCLSLRNDPRVDQWLVAKHFIDTCKAARLTCGSRGAKGKGHAGVYAVDLFFDRLEALATIDALGKIYGKGVVQWKLPPVSERY